MRLAHRILDGLPHRILDGLPHRILDGMDDAVLSSTEGRSDGAPRHGTPLAGLESLLHLPEMMLGCSRMRGARDGRWMVRARADDDETIIR